VPESPPFFDEAPEPDADCDTFRKLPQGAQVRLETIAALAVRLREAVRRLSQERETNQEAPNSPK